MKKFFAMLLALSMLLTLVACGGNNSSNTPSTSAPSTSTPSTSAPATPPAGESVPTPQPVPEGKTEILFWSVWTGSSGECVQKMADEFNASQDKYFVNLTYAGAYAEALAKYQATSAGNRPDIVAVSTEYVAFFNDNEDYAVNIQKFIDEDNYDYSDVLPHLRNAYSNSKGEATCAPIGNTVVGYFYNNEVLKANGLNADDINSYEELVAACDVLQANGVQTPFYIAPNSIYYTFPVTAQGYQYVDNNNGMDALCTRSLINEGELAGVTTRFFDYLGQMAQKGQIVPTTLASADVRQMFINGEIAFMSSTCSSLNAIGNLAEWKLDFGFHPAITVDAGVESRGECTGGGALFIGNNEDDNKARGAWEFLKWVMKPENTVAFAMATGYLPTTHSGWNDPTYQAFVAEKFPTAVKSYESQANTPEDCYNALLPMFGDFHQIGIDMINAVLDDPTGDPAEFAAEFAARADECIELYTLSKG